MAQDYRLGVDLGTNSLGWALIDLDRDGKPCGIRDMGVHIFQDGRNPKDGTSLAVKRRVPRGMRRRRDRFLLRKKDLMAAPMDTGSPSSGTSPEARHRSLCSR